MAPFTLPHSPLPLSRGSVRDHDRPLTEGGRAAARAIASKLASEGWVPQLILCSDATRTVQTLSEMADAAPSLTGSAPVHFLGSLYTAPAMDGETVAEIRRRVVAAAADGLGCVLCIGHNKGWEEAAAFFSGEPVSLRWAGGGGFFGGESGGRPACAHPPPPPLSHWARGVPLSLATRRPPPPLEASRLPGSRPYPACPCPPPPSPLRTCPGAWDRNSRAI